MCSEAFHITSPPKLVTECIQRECESPKRPSIGSLLNLPPLPPPSIPQDVNGVTVGVQRATTFPVSNNTNGGQWTDIHSLTDIAAQRTRRRRRSPPSKHPQKTKTKKTKKKRKHKHSAHTTYAPHCGLPRCLYRSRSLLHSKGGTQYGQCPRFQTIKKGTWCCTTTIKDSNSSGTTRCR